MMSVAKKKHQDILRPSPWGGGGGGGGFVFWLVVLSFFNQ